MNGNDAFFMSGHTANRLGFDLAHRIGNQLAAEEVFQGGKKSHAIPQHSPKSVSSASESKTKTDANTADKSSTHISTVYRDFPTSSEYELFGKEATDLYYKIKPLYDAGETIAEEDFEILRRAGISMKQFGR